MSFFKRSKSVSRLAQAVQQPYFEVPKPGYQKSTLIATRTLTLTGAYVLYTCPVNKQAYIALVSVSQNNNFNTIDFADWVLINLLRAGVTHIIGICRSNPQGVGSFQVPITFPVLIDLKSGDQISCTVNRSTATTSWYALVTGTEEQII